jgi:catechol 2,3-dioxygenase-like lactoylglutathione lyase family enzyme
MIGYVTLGTNDLARAAAFYDKLLAEVGAKRQWEFERGIGWARSADTPTLAIMKPFDGKPASVGNGVMVSFAAPDQATVQKIHALALSLGGTDEGAPGLRGDSFYGCYFRDLDGNKLGAFVAG